MLINSVYGDGMDPVEYEYVLAEATEFFGCSREEAISKLKGSTEFKKYLDQGYDLDHIYDKTDAVIWDLLTVKATVSSGTKERFRESLVQDVLSKYLKGKNVVDYGCGIGREVVAAIEAGFSGIGVDRGKTLEFAEWYTERLYPDSEYSFMSSSHFWSCTPSVDAIMCFEYFEHDSDPEGLVGKFWDILPAGGLLICNSRSFNPHDTGHLKHNFKYQYAFEEIIASIGFKCLYFPYNPPNLYNIAVWQKVEKGSGYYDGATTERGEW